MSIDDVALGYTTTQLWADPADWIWSTTRRRIQRSSTSTRSRLHSHTGRQGVPVPRIGHYAAPLGRTSSVSSCSAEIVRSPNRVRLEPRTGSLPLPYAREWKQVAGVEHPATVYLREAAVLPALDEWLASVVAPGQLDETVAMLLSAPDEDEATDTRVDAAQRTLADCKGRLARYRGAIDEGVDPRVVATWIAEVEGQRLAAAQVLAEHDEARIDEKALRAMIKSVDIGAMLKHADPADKAAVYADLGLTLTYDPAQREVVAETRPAYVARVGGGTCQPARRDWPDPHGVACRLNRHGRADRRPIKRIERTSQGRSSRHHL